MGDQFGIVESYKYLGHLVHKQLLDIYDIKFWLDISMVNIILFLENLVMFQ